MTINNDQDDRCRQARREPLRHAFKHLKTFDFPRKTPLTQCACTDQRHIADSLASDLRRIENEAELKRWLKEQWQLAKATSA